MVETVFASGPTVGAGGSASEVVRVAVNVVGTTVPLVTTGTGAGGSAGSALCAVNELATMDADENVTRMSVPGMACVRAAADETCVSADAKTGVVVDKGTTRVGIWTGSVSVVDENSKTDVTVLANTDDNVTVDDDCWTVGLSSAGLSGALEVSNKCVMDPVSDQMGVTAVSCVAYTAIPAKTRPAIAIGKILGINDRQATGWSGQTNKKNNHLAV